MESVIRVVARDDFHLELWFRSGEHRIFDARPYLDRGVFQRLKNVALFKQAYVAMDTVCWPGDLDIAPETLYDLSVLVKRTENHACC
ncbi:Protein of unknown function [Geoalkalibacter ferrihydriticus]|uniref:DUF2442 domain-containing protein n=2 Tax=Geoalkalibacter ferrihydriticus TaxID=392333 RepID=A0A0C2HEU7_9BACT|nr:DUF2442 domain-containing protein [Geoalkalibacter ferrihydriticus]KIH75486.1 hypothetical protein GFER_16150 [Geoalkalibacter ferrihydriticus DSM 17813]SDM83907.1 Protein of unknown function [Geoalkalibacter ferrihydriticus]